MTKMLELLHIASPVFPTGAFSHSYGFESYISDGKITNASDFLKLLKTSVKSSLGPVDAPAAAFAYDVGDIYELDRLVTALKATKEMRGASRRTGRSFLKLAAGIYPFLGLQKYADAAANGDFDANYSVVFGLCAARLGIKKYDAVSAFCFNSVYSLIQTAIKTIPLGQLDGQLAAVKMYDDILEISENAVLMSPEDMGGFSPALDIASMRHEDLYTRLYMS